MKKIYKYETGAEIPEGAIYLGTVTQTEEEIVTRWKEGAREMTNSRWEKCWLVWHYFLVDTNV